MTEASPVGDGSFEPWVGPVVYSRFGAQAVGIAVLFALYARARWPGVLRSRGGCRSAGPRSVLVPAAWVAAVLLGVVAAARLLWALDPAAAASFGLTDARGTTERAADAGAAAFAGPAAGCAEHGSRLEPLGQGSHSARSARPLEDPASSHCSCSSRWKWTGHWEWTEHR